MDWYLIWKGWLLLFLKTAVIIFNIQAAAQNLDEFWQVYAMVKP